MKKLILIVAMVMFLGMGTLAQADLIDRGADTLGNHLIYDTDLNITWYDSPANMLTWYSAMTWAENLTVTMADGQSFTDWRLPTTPGTIWGYTKEGEMGHLYYDELDNAAGGITNRGPFQQALNPSYGWPAPWFWTSSDYGPPNYGAWVFHFNAGYQDPYYKGGGVQQWVLAVRDGDVAPINKPPVADCQDVVVAAGADGYADASINYGSYDPDGDLLDYEQDPSGPYAVGVYTVTLTVTDPYGESDTCTAMVVVYDPSAGFVTGGGWIWSPAGAYADDPLLEGKANFGFVAKYKKGASVPDGQTEFVFTAGNLNFHSSSYDWLVVAGAKAMFKGTGTVNGAGNYGFMLSAVDAAQTPSTDVDLFRIKIWDKDDGDDVVYDNQLGDAEDADPTTAIGGGSIIVHTGKK